MIPKSFKIFVSLCAYMVPLKGWDVRDELRNIQGAAEQFRDELRNIQGAAEQFRDELRNIQGAAEQFCEIFLDVLLDVTAL